MEVFEREPKEDLTAVFFAGTLDLYSPFGLILGFTSKATDRTLKPLGPSSAGPKRPTFFC